MTLENQHLGLHLDLGRNTSREAQAYEGGPWKLGAGEELVVPMTGKTEGRAAGTGAGAEGRGRRAVLH